MIVGDPLSPRQLEDIEKILDKYDKPALIFYAWTMIKIDPHAKTDEGWYDTSFKITEYDKAICVSVYHRYKNTMRDEEDKEVKKWFRALKKRLKELEYTNV